MFHSSEIVIHSTNDQPFALELVADHSDGNTIGAYHQGGPLRNQNLFFRINNSEIGIAGRSSKIIPLEFRWAKYINGCGSSWIGMSTINVGEDPYMDFRYRNDFAARWDTDVFCVVTKKYSNVALLESFAKAFQANDMALWLSHGQFSLSSKVSLFLGIKSKIPKIVTDEMKQYDENIIKWKKDPKYTNLVSQLANARRSTNCFSLVNKKSTGELVYWVSPYENRRYNAGLFDQFEMDAWVNDLGPIVKGAAPLVRPQPVIVPIVPEITIPVVEPAPAVVTATFPQRTTTFSIPRINWGRVTNTALDNLDLEAAQRYQDELNRLVRTRR